MRLYQAGLAAATAFIVLHSTAVGQTPAPAQSSQATPAPAFSVAGIYVQPSADLLRRFGIISGDPNGDMRYGATITRAEMAKVVVAALGMEDAARAATLLKAPFPDTEDHWARGYIAIARMKQVAGGYQDGTYRPNAPVTNAEAVTFLLRAAGVRPLGPWPVSYLNAAAEHSVLNDALADALPAGAPAQRGAVFLLAERAFTRIRDAGGQTLIERSFRPQPPGLEATVRIEGSQVVVSGKVTGAPLVYVNGVPVWAPGGTFQAKVPYVATMREVLVYATADTGAQTVRQIPLK